MGAGTSFSKSRIQIFIVCLIICFPATTINSAGEGQGDYPPPNEGDWIIVNNTYVHDESILLNGNLIIKENATLTLENVTFNIHSNVSSIRGIYVNSGGVLIANFTKISSYPKSFIFNVEGNLTMESCIISNTTSGIRNDNGFVQIENSTIHNNDFAGVYSNGTTILKNNVIHSNIRGIVIAFFKNALFENNTIISNEWGIVCIAFGFAYIIGNTIENNSLGGLNLELGMFEIHNNTIASNGGFGIRSDHSTSTVTNNTIFDNERWGIYSIGAPIYQENNYFERDGKYNGEGDVLMEWEVLISVFDADNNSIDNVNITIFDNNDELIWSGRTIGNVRVLVLREYEINNNGTLIMHTPFTVIAEKEDFTSSTSLDIAGSEASIFESSKLNVVLDIDEEEEREVSEYKFPVWGLFVVVGIWIFAAVMILLGIVIGLSNRKKRGQ
jgi:hypothetical protein